MKPLDCFLIPFAVGSTLFTTYILAMQDEAPKATRAQTARFNAIVVHANDCPNAPRLHVLPCHFLVRPDGAVVSTHAWKSMEPVASTKNPKFDRAAVSIIAPANRTPASDAALERLVQTLSKQHRVSKKNVFRHCGKS